MEEREDIKEGAKYLHNINHIYKITPKVIFPEFQNK